MSDPNKLSVELAPDVAEALRFLADQRGVTITDPSAPVPQIEGNQISGHPRGFINLAPEPNLTYCGTCGRKFPPEQLTRHECEACRNR